MADLSANDVGIQFTDDLAKVANPIAGVTFVFVGNAIENTLYRCISTGPAVWESVVWDAVIPPSGLIYVFSTFFPGKPSGSKMILNHAVTEKRKLRATAPQSKGRAEVAATASTTFTLWKVSGTGSPSSIGTAVFAIAGRLPTYTVSSDVTFDPATNDALQVTAPATPDVTLSDINLSIHTIRIT